MDSDHEGESIPSMNPELDAYLAQMKDTIKTAEARTHSGVRTTDHTFTNFKLTSQDRLWTLKTKGDFIDAILVTEDGHREVSNLKVPKLVISIYPFHSLCIWT